MSDESTNGLLTADELAAFLGVTRSALYSQRVRGEAPGILGFHIGRRMYFDLDEVIAYARAERDASRNKNKEESNE